MPAASASSPGAPGAAGPGRGPAPAQPGAAGDPGAPGAAPACVVIQGETEDGRRFRPSDWNERLHGTLRALDEDEYQVCHQFVHLTTVDGKKCVRIDCRLRDEDERLFNFFVRFARDNNLRLREFTAEEWQKTRDDRPA